MSRPITLFTGQWADLPLEKLAALAGKDGWKYDGLELACWGDHFDVQRALAEPAYCQSRHDLLARHGLKVWAISNHLVGQAVCDPIDIRHKSILPARIWGDGKPEGVQHRAAQEMIDTARAAAKLGIKVVNGFTGSAVWHKLYFFPPTSPAEIDDGFADFARRWTPILDAFQREGVRFGLEVHPTEIAYDTLTARRALEAVNHHPAFGFNFDPSHLHWQFVDPVAFIRAFPDRIFHCHVKDAARTLTGESGILGSHLSFGDPRRGWDFRSPGRGDIDFESIIRALNHARYTGPLSVEWEDSGMDRLHGAAESASFCRKLDFTPAHGAFDAAFEKR
jgi:sugar phosphate isomerase/epimerase